MNKAVVTLMVGGEANEMGRVSISLMKEYARKCDAEFVLLTQSDISQKTSPYYEKMQIGSLLNEYDMILYIDIDILVSPRAANLFECVPFGYLGVVSVAEIYHHHVKQQELLDMILGKIKWRLPYFNSGVMVACRNHATLFNIDDTLIEQWIDGKNKNNITALNDQNIFNYRANIQDLDLYLLENTFNFTRAWGCFNERFNKDLIHYAGFRGNRVKRMKWDAKILNSRMVYLFQHYPILVKYIDRLWG